MKPIFIIFLVFGFFSCEVSNNEKETKNHMDTTDVVKENPQKDSIVDLPKKMEYDYDTTQWTDLHLLDSTIIIDMRYATTNNFVKEKMYDCGRCFLRPEVARRVVQAHQQLQEGGLGLKMLDCFRPRPIQQKLWDKFQDPRYVTPPEKGSMHNRGAAVDLTIVDEEGNQLDMGTAFDFFGKEAHHAYMDLSEDVLRNRKLLKETMISVDLHPITTEWWHYSYKEKSYALSDMLWNCEN